MLTDCEPLTGRVAAGQMSRVPERAPTSMLASWPLDLLVELAAALRADSRRSAKRLLHDRGLVSGSADVDAAELYLRRRKDWPTIDAAVADLLARRVAGADAFDLRLAIVNRMRVSGFDTREGRVALANQAGVSADLIEAIVGGGDAPLSAATKLLGVLDARRIVFGPG